MFVMDGERFGRLTGEVGRTAPQFEQLVPSAGRFLVFSSPAFCERQAP